MVIWVAMCRADERWNSYKSGPGGAPAGSQTSDAQTCRSPMSSLLLFGFPLDICWDISLLFFSIHGTKSYFCECVRDYTWEINWVQWAKVAWPGLNKEAGCTTMIQGLLWRSTSLAEQAVAVLLLFRGLLWWSISLPWALKTAERPSDVSFPYPRRHMGNGAQMAYKYCWSWLMCPDRHRKDWDQAPESGEHKLTVHGKKENIQYTLNVAINLQNVTTWKCVFWEVHSTLSGWVPSAHLTLIFQMMLQLDFSTLPLHLQWSGGGTYTMICPLIEWRADTLTRHLEIAVTGTCQTLLSVWQVETLRLGVLTLMPDFN